MSEDVPFSEKEEYECDSCGEVFDELVQYAYHSCQSRSVKQESLDEGDPCPECGYKFDSNEWECHHPNTGPWVREIWIYTCPGCNQKTCQIST